MPSYSVDDVEDQPSHASRQQTHESRRVQISQRAHEIFALLGDEKRRNAETNDIPDHEHARALQLLRDIFVLARPGATNSALSGRLISDDSRSLLLSVAMTLDRMAPSSRSMREELLRSTMLFVCVIFSDMNITAAHAAEASARSHTWLDEAWETHLFVPSPQEIAADATLCDAIGRGARRRGVVETAMRVESHAYIASAQCQLERSVFDGLQPAISLEERSLRQLMNDPVAQSLVEAADADLGQQVFRDLILSFRMPRRSVGWRRQLLFDRSTAKVAERLHRELLNAAHNAAMQTPSHVWVHGVIGQIVETETVGDFLNVPFGEKASAAATLASSTGEGGGTGGGIGGDKQEPEENNAVGDDVDDTEHAVERVCCILAGLAMNIANDVEQARKGDAFDGRVDLPFLRTTSNRAPGTLRMALIRGDWVCYSVGSRGAKVHVRGRGLAGLLGCATTLVDDVRKVSR